MAADLRASRAALASLFLGFGIVSGTWAARLPAVQHRLRLDDGELGLVIFSVSAASVAVLPLAGWLVARLGGRTITVAGIAVSAAGLALGGLAPSLVLLALAVALMGAGFGVADVGGNAYGVALERRYGRPILTGFHAAWSFGLLAGSAVAGAAAALGVGVRAHFALVAAVGAFASRPFLHGEHEDGAAGMRRFAWPRGPLAALALATRSPVPAIIGFACIGAGVAMVVPAVFRAAGSVAGIAAGAGIASVAVAGYSGSVANGPAIGFVARGVGLTGALALLGVACALVAVLAPRTQ